MATAFFVNMATYNVTAAQMANPAGTGTSGVQGVINGASTGDTVIFPAGTYSWTAGITVTTAITITSTPGTCTIQNNYGNGYAIAFTSPTNGHIRFNGVNITQIAENQPGSSGGFWYAVNCARSDFNFTTNTISSPGNKYTIIV